MQVIDEHKPRVGGHTIALRDTDEVSRDEARGIHLFLDAAADDAGTLPQIGLQSRERTFGLVFLIEAETDIDRKSGENKK